VSEKIIKKWNMLLDKRRVFHMLLACSISLDLLVACVLHNLYSSPSIIRMNKSRRMRWAGHVMRMGEKRNAYRILVGNPEGRGPLGRPRRRWGDNIKMDLR
jgi:hypothetical protein